MRKYKDSQISHEDKPTIELITARLNVSHDQVREFLGDRPFWIVQQVGLGRTISEIGKELMVHPSTVKMTYYRSLRKLDHYDENTNNPLMKLDVRIWNVLSNLDLHHESLDKIRAAVTSGALHPINVRNFGVGSYKKLCDALKIPMIDRRQNALKIKVMGLSQQWRRRVGIIVESAKDHGRKCSDCELSFMRAMNECADELDRFFY